MVGWQTLHRGGFPLLVRRRRAQSRTLALRAGARAAAKRREAACRIPRPADNPLQLDTPQPAVPAGARRAKPALSLPAGALPEAVPCEIRRQGQARGARQAAQAAQLGGALPPARQRLSQRQSRLALARALGARDTAARRSLRLQAQSLFPSPRTRRTS